MSVRHVFFDVNGTLFDPSAMAEPLAGGGAELVDGILADTVTLAMAASLGGDYRDFSELLRIAALRRLELIGEGAEADRVVAAMKRMRPFPEASEAIEVLRAAGVGAGALSNSSTAAVVELIESSGLSLEPVIGTDQVGRFKPDPAVYRHACDAVGVPANEVALVTVHSWDANGAMSAGLRAAWIARKERLPLVVERPADFHGGDLAEAARAIAAESVR